MGTGHQLKYKWTTFALDALLTAVTKRITNSNLLMNRLVGWNIFSNILRYEVRAFRKLDTIRILSPFMNWIFYSNQVWCVFPVRMCLGSHTFIVPVITVVNHTVWEGTLSLRGLPWSGSHDLRGLECATSTQIPFSAWARRPAGFPPPSTSTSSPADQS